MLCMAVMMAACTQSTLLHHYEPVDDDGWDRTDTLSYELPTIPKDGDYQISLGVRYNNFFPYEGLWIVAETSMKKPMLHRNDTLYFPIIDEKGHPMGKGLSMMQADTLLTTLHFEEGQSGHIRLRHIMIREVVPGITDIGIKVRKK